MNLLKKVAEKTIAEKYTVENFVFDFFERRDDVHYVKQRYIDAAEKYKTIDMRYDDFNWQMGVGLYGLIEAAGVLGEDRYFEFIREWTDFHIDKGIPAMTVNSTIPYYAFLQLYKKYGDGKYYALCDNAAKYVISAGTRADEGALEHTVLEGRNASQIWADTVFMAAVFLAEWGSFTGNIAYQNEAARQILLHYKYLTDKNTGLMFHAYSCAERNNLSAVKWGRANGWGVISSVEILERLPEYHAARSSIISNLQKHIDKLVKYQAECGGWHTVLDDEGSYIETTAACCVYYALKKGLKLGYISGDYSAVIAKAENYIKLHISDEGEALMTSAGTPVMASAEEYNKIPCAMSYYGQGLALMALSQLDGKE